MSAVFSSGCRLEYTTGFIHPVNDLTIAVRFFGTDFTFAAENHLIHVAFTSQFLRVWVEVGGLIAAEETVPSGQAEPEGEGASEDTWHHFVYRRTVTTIELILDGAVIGSESSDAASRAGNGTFQLGQYPPEGGVQTQFIGRMQDAVIVQSSLTAPQIADLIDVRNPAWLEGHANLLAWWPMRTGIGARTDDYGPSNRDLTEVGTFTDGAEDPNAEWLEGDQTSSVPLLSCDGVLPAPTAVAAEQSATVPVLECEAVALAPSAAAVHSATAPVLQSAANLLTATASAAHSAAVPLIAVEAAAPPPTAAASHSATVPRVDVDAELPAASATAAHAATVPRIDTEAITPAPNATAGQSAAVPLIGAEGALPEPTALPGAVAASAPLLAAVGQTFAPGASAAHAATVPRVDVVGELPAPTGLAGDSTAGVPLLAALASTPAPIGLAGASTAAPPLLSSIVVLPVPSGLAAGLASIPVLECDVGAFPPVAQQGLTATVPRVSAIGSVLVLIASGGEHPEPIYPSAGRLVHVAAQPRFRVDAEQPRLVHVAAQPRFRVVVDD